MTTSGRSATTASRSALVDSRTSTSRCSISRASQSVTPPISRRQPALAANATWPPSRPVASNRTTSWPRQALIRAASRPAGPPPATTTAFAGGRDSRFVGQGFFASRRGVVNAVAMVHAEGRADARTNAIFLAGFDLADDVRVGDVGARHADHVDDALANGAARGRRVDDAAGVKRRQRQIPRERPRPGPGKSRAAETSPA